MKIRPPQIGVGGGVNVFCPYLYTDRTMYIGQTYTIHTQIDISTNHGYRLLYTLYILISILKCIEPQCECQFNETLYVTFI